MMSPKLRLFHGAGRTATTLFAPLPFVLRAGGRREGKRRGLVTPASVSPVVAGGRGRGGTVLTLARLGRWFPMLSLSLVVLIG